MTYVGDYTKTILSDSYVAWILRVLITIGRNELSLNPSVFCQSSCSKSEERVNLKFRIGLHYLFGCREIKGNDKKIWYDIRVLFFFIYTYRRTDIYMRAQPFASASLLAVDGYSDSLSSLRQWSLLLGGDELNNFWINEGIVS